MKIGICAEFIGMKAGGTESYIVNILKALMEIDRENEYTIYVPSRDALKGLHIPANFHISSLGTNNPWVRNLIVMPFKLMMKPVDILHVQNVVPLGWRGKLVATIHDISFDIFPDTFPKAMRFRLSKLVRKSARKATIVLTGSENTKKDLINIYGVPSEKIDVAPYAHDEKYRFVDEREKVDEVKKKYGIPEKFILYVGAIQPRKNIDGLLKACEMLREKYGVERKLVIVGKEAWLYSDIIKSMKDVKHPEEIIYTGYVPDEELPLLFNAAELFVCPSFYEGFGLVVLEAMACGTPVITSNVSSLPEVIGDAGIMIDPHNCEELAQAMHRVLTEPGLKEEMRKKGLERSKGFSWRHTAKRTQEVYNRISKG